MKRLLSLLSIISSSFLFGQNYAVYYKHINQSIIARQINKDSIKADSLEQLAILSNTVLPEHCISILNRKVKSNKYTGLEKLFYDAGINGMSMFVLKKEVSFKQVDNELMKKYRLENKKGIELYEKNRNRKISKKLRKALIRDQRVRIVQKSNYKKMYYVDSTNMITLRCIIKELGHFPGYKEIGYIGVNAYLMPILLHADWPDTKSVFHSMVLGVKTGNLDNESVAEVVDRKSYIDGIKYMIDSNMHIVNDSYPDTIFSINPISFGQIHYFNKKIGKMIIPEVFDLSKVNYRRNVIFLMPFEEYIEVHKYYYVADNKEIRKNSFFFIPKKQ